MPRIINDFVGDADGIVTKNCIGMYSREGEYVPFYEPCNCSGAVEEWYDNLHQMKDQSTDCSG